MTFPVIPLRNLDVHLEERLQVSRLYAGRGRVLTGRDTVGSLIVAFLTFFTLLTCWSIVLDTTTPSTLPTWSDQEDGGVDLSIHDI